MYMQAAGLASQKFSVACFVVAFQTLGTAWAVMFFTSQRWPFNAISLGSSLVPLFSMYCYFHYQAVAQVYKEAVAIEQQVKPYSSSLGLC